MSLIKIVHFDVMGDERGSLIAFEQNKNIPFDIRRVYYIFGTQPDVARGFHAHKDLHQLAICVRGSCRFVLDNGYEKDEILLDSPASGLLIEGLIWREMYDFSDDCVLLVLASEYYDEADYIKVYNEFKSVVSKNT